MDYDIGLITSLRSQASLVNSIESLRKCDINKKINLFIDKTEDEQNLDFISNITNIEIHASSTKLGMVENTRIAWKFLFEKTNSPWIIVCEDDILCKSCLFEILKRIVPNINRQIGYISCYTPLIYSQMADYTFNNFGWKKINMGMHTWGTQFIMMQRNTCELILNKWNKFHTIEKLQDRIIGEILQDSGLDCFYPFPSLVNHVGLMNSTHMKAPLIGNTAWLYGLNVHEKALLNFEVFS